MTLSPGKTFTDATGIGQIRFSLNRLRRFVPFVCLVVLALLQTLTAAGASNGVISVHFVGAGTAMASSETAGVIAKANWNQAAGATSGATPLSLLDENGTPTGATANWVAESASATYATDAPGNARMMRGYLDTGEGNPSTVMVSGLPAGKYTIYVYANAASMSGVPIGSGSYQIGGPGITETTITTGEGASEPGFSGTFIQATNTDGNYVLFKEVTVLSGFTLTATPSVNPNSPPSAPVNGIQIVPSGAAPDFSMVVLPMSETVTDGGTALYLVNVEALNGFTGTVNLAVSSPAPGGATESVNPATVTGSGSAIIAIHTPSGTAYGGETQPIMGTSGSLSHGADFSTTLLATPDFTVSGSAEQFLSPGGSAIYTLDIETLNGFTGTVHLAVSGLPAGATASLSAASLYSSGQSTLTIHTAATMQTGYYTFNVNATSGALSHTETLYLGVDSTPDFSLSAGPASQTLTGSTAKYLIGVGALSGFTGTVSLAVNGLPPGATASFSQPSVTGSGISILTVTENGATPSGASTLTITGTSGSLSHMVTVTLVAGTAPDFSISAAPLSPYPPSPGFAIIYIVTLAPLNGFKGTVNLSASGLPAGATASFSPASVSGLPGGSTFMISDTPPPGSLPGNATVTIMGTSGSLSHSATITLSLFGAQDFGLSAQPNSQLVTAGSNATYPVFVDAFLDMAGRFYGTVSLTVTGLPAGTAASFEYPSVTFSSPPAYELLSNLTVTTTASTPAGTSTFTVTGVSGAVSRTLTLTLTVFQPGSQPVISVDFVGGGTPMGASEAAGIVSRANWNDAIGAASATPLSLVDQTGSPTGVTLSWTSDNVWSLPIADTAGNYRMMRGYLDNGSGNPTTLTASGIPPGTYDIYVYTDGDNGSVSRTGTYQLSPLGTPASSVSASDPPETNFSGAFLQANNSTGNYVLFSGVPLGLGLVQPPGFTLTATPDVDRAPVNAIQIVLSSGPSPNFSVSSAQSSQTVVPGGAASYSINVAPLNGFNEPVSLSGPTDLPAGAVASFSPAVLTSLPATSVLTITTTASTPVGTAPLGIVGTSGAVMSTGSVDLVVEPAGGTEVTSIDFVGGGTAMAKSEAAGVLIRENWNDAAGAKSTSALQLVDENGSRSGATVTWSADDVQKTTIADLAGDYRMMRGYLDTGSGNPTTVTVSGLAAGTYSIYVYVDGNNGSATDTATYQISGPGIPTASATATDAANTDFSGTFLQADNGDGNYIVFSNVAVTSGFTLTATPVSPGGSAPVNGIQIVR